MLDAAAKAASRALDRVSTGGDIWNSNCDRNGVDDERSLRARETLTPRLKWAKRIAHGGPSERPRPQLRECPN